MISALAVWALGPTWTLAAFGDVMLGRHIALRLANHRPADAFGRVRAAWVGSDFVVGNLECALSSRPALAKAISLPAPNWVVRQLWGLTALSLANNHAGDCGPSGFSDARSALASVGVAGVFDQPVVVERRGLRVAFIGVCDLPGYRISPSDEAIRSAVRGSDVAVAMVHWGLEGSPKPSDAQRALTRRLWGLGVKIVLGSHPHVLQPVVRWGSRLVAYSLGNFLFDVPFLPRFAAQRESEVLLISLDRHGVRGVRSAPVTLVHGFPVAKAALARVRA